jgi:hypothetical protein
MLGKLYASPTVHEAFFCCTLQSFWIPRNIAVEKSRFETRLNGESSSASLLYYLNTDTNNTHFSKKFCCIGVSEGNTQNSAGNNPVPNRMAPRQLPGVYMILCLVNNKRYYGESNNVSARLSRHKSRLRSNSHEVLELQRDYNIYGEETFEFSPLWMEKNSTKEERLALETEFIARFLTLCYNKFAKSNLKGENNPFWGRSHSSETKEQIARSQRENRQNSTIEGFALNIKGIIYPSISEASRQTNHSRDTIRRWLNDPNNSDCVAVDASKPQKSGNTNTGNSNSVDPLVANRGIAKKISLYGEIYDSITSAAKKRNCTRVIIQRLLRNHPDKCFIINPSEVVRVDDEADSV